MIDTSFHYNGKDFMSLALPISFVYFVYWDEKEGRRPRREYLLIILKSRKKLNPDGSHLCQYLLKQLDMVNDEGGERR